MSNEIPRINQESAEGGQGEEMIAPSLEHQNVEGTPDYRTEMNNRKEAASKEIEQYKALIAGDEKTIGLLEEHKRSLEAQGRQFHDQDLIDQHTAEMEERKRVLRELEGLVQ